jgi:membrane protease subunit (stomatin/prohibitin family)
VALDVIKNAGPASDLAWKYPSDEAAYGSQVIVMESEEAVFFKDGQALDTFGPGRHTIESGNVPLLSKLINLPFGGRTPLPVSIWFVNKAAKLEGTKWGTRSPIQVFDTQFQLPVNLGAYGSLGIRIGDSRNFVVQLVGNQATFSLSRVTESVNGYIERAFKDLVAEAVSRGQSVLSLSTQLEEFSEATRQKLNDEFRRYGLELIDFFVESIQVLDDDPAYQKIKSALSEAAELRIKAAAAGMSTAQFYQTDRSLDVMQSAAENESGAAGAMLAGGLGAGLGLGAGMAAGQQVGQSMASNLGGTPPAVEEDTVARLQKLKVLLDQGLISEDDFNTKKAQIMEDL